MIYERADADKPFMGLTTFSGDFPVAKDIGIAKNYLKEDELKVLNRIVSDILILRKYRQYATILCI